MSGVIGLFNYWAVIVLMMIGLYVVIARSNLVKKIIGLSVFQSAVIMFYISMGKVAGGTAPILPQDHGKLVTDSGLVYSNPVPHVLMLTAIGPRVNQITSPLYGADAHIDAVLHAAQRVVRETDQA